MKYTKFTISRVKVLNEKNKQMKQNIKVALLFSGQPRFLEERENPCFQFIYQNIIQKYHCDVFCHYWWSAKSSDVYVTAPWSGLGTMKIHPDIPQIVQTLYSPKVQIHEEPLKMQEYSNYKQFESRTVYNHLSMYTSMKRCWEIFSGFVKEHNLEYDFVIRCRFDSVLDDFPNLETLDKNKVHITYDHRNCAQVNHCWICPQSLSQYLFNMIDYIDDALKIKNSFVDEVFMYCMLINLKEQKKVNGIDRKQFSAKLYRGKGKITGGDF